MGLRRGRAGCPRRPTPTPQPCQDAPAARCPPTGGNNSQGLSGDITVPRAAGQNWCSRCHGGAQGPRPRSPPSSVFATGQHHGANGRDESSPKTPGPSSPWCTRGRRYFLGAFLLVQVLFAGSTWAMSCLNPGPWIQERLSLRPSAHEGPERSSPPSPELQPQEVQPLGTQWPPSTLGRRSWPCGRAG